MMAATPNAIGAQQTHAPATQSTLPRFTIVLEPAAPDPAGHNDKLHLTLTLEDLHIPAHQPVLTLPLAVDNVQTPAHTLTALSARDARGDLPLEPHDVTTPEPSRQWLATRSIAGTLTVQYDVPITDAPNPLGGAPPLELRTDAGTLSGELRIFLLRPPNLPPHRITLHWDLSALPPGARGASSMGLGDLRLNSLAPLETLFVFAGSLHTVPQQPAPNGFFSAWQGDPPFPPTPLLQWTQSLYGFYTRFFEAPLPLQPFTVLLRPNPVNAGGGVALGNAFLGTFDAHTEVEPLQITIAHEIVHTFLGSLDPPDDPNTDWFTEGIAVYYERLLPLRAGRITPAEFLEDLNATAARYYTDALLHTPESDVAAHFWQDTRIRVLPYDRGSLYFATVDAEVRQATAAAHSLDDLILAMLTLRRHGRPMDASAWTRLLTQYLGPTGPAEFRSMLAGGLVLPPSDAFGPCFARTQVPLRRFQLGFTPDVLAAPTRIVRGLIPGSAAALAGIQNGDHILKPVPQDLLQADQYAEITLQVTHPNGQTRTITYLPRAETVPAYQWRRVTRVPDSACVPDFHIRAPLQPNA